MEKKQLKNNKENELKLIPKAEDYIKYMINVIIKLPRVEKFSIGTEYKNSMYKMLNSILYVSKIEITERFYHINFIDAELNCQRIFLRIMKDSHWIDEKKFNIAIEKIYEIGKIIGGLQKYYAKNNTK